MIVKNKIMKAVIDCLQTVNLTKGAIDEVKAFTYLGSVVSTRGGTKQDVEVGWEKPEQLTGRWINCRNPKSLKGQLK